MGRRIDLGFREVPSAGTVLGRYIVLEEVGRGAMGRVFRAYDPKLQREVALKEVRGGGRSEVATHRIIGEARAMAKLSHPNVVAIHDVELVEPDSEHEPGIDDSAEGDRVVLVMEFVPGQTLKDWLEADPHRPWTEVVSVFMKAGRGLAGAHSAGLLHRDFKPANVLVSTEGSVKVTDFGLAQLTEAAYEDDPACSTNDGNSQSVTRTALVVGTPRYMAPEQHDGGALSPAADQYALCVSLWEALHGAAPFRGHGLAADKRRGPPAWRAASVPAPVVEAILRGLSPEPEHRWPDMVALLAALQFDPLAQRRRWRAVGGALFGTGVIVASWQLGGDGTPEPCSGAREHLTGAWDPARQLEIEASIVGTELPYAVATWEQARDSLDAYSAEWAAMHSEACQSTLRGEQSAEAMDLRMSCLHRARVALGATTDVLAEADANVVNHVVPLVTALPGLDRCADVETLLETIAPPPPDEAEAVERARVFLADAKAEQLAGRYTAAWERVEMARATLPAVTYEPLTTEVALREGFVLSLLGKYDSSELAFRDALERSSRWQQWDLLFEASRELAYVVGYRGQASKEGLRYAELARGLAGDDSVRRGSVEDTVGSVLNAQGKYGEAERKHQEALGLLGAVLGEEHRRVINARNNLANALYLQGKYAKAEAQHRHVLALRKRTLGAEHPEVATSRNNLAAVFAAQGRFEEAQTEFQRTLDLRSAVLGPDHTEVTTSRGNLAVALAQQGKFDEAQRQLRVVVEARTVELGAEHPVTATARSNLASVLLAMGKYAEAEAEHRRILEARIVSLGPKHGEVATSRNNLAVALARQGKLEEAETEHRRALAIRIEALGNEHPQVATSHNNLGIVLVAQGRIDEGIAEHQLALPLAVAALGPDHPEVTKIRNNIAAATRKADGNSGVAEPRAEG